MATQQHNDSSGRIDSPVARASDGGMSVIRAIQQATLAARKRTGDNSIATRVRQGRGQVVGIDYSAKGTCDRIRELSPWVAVADLPGALDKVQ